MTLIKALGRTMPMVPTFFYPIQTLVQGQAGTPRSGGGGALLMRRVDLRRACFRQRAAATPGQARKKGLRVIPVRMALLNAQASKMPLQIG